MKNDIRLLFKAKIQAASIHLGISIFIFLGILYVILFDWYPEPFFTAAGGWDGIKLMAAVDLVLGPSLTLIIYNYTKARKEILFDLSIIAVVQAGALIWGGLQVYSERPVALVMWEGVFYTVTEDYYQQQNISLKDVATFSDEEPLIIYAESEGSAEQLEMIQLLNKRKIPPYAQVHLYKSVKDSVGEVLSYHLSESQLPADLGVEATINKQYIFPVKAKYRNMLLYLDAEANLQDITLQP